MDELDALDRINLKEKTIEKLKKEYVDLLKEVAEVDKEIKLAQQIKRQRGSEFFPNATVVSDILPRYPQMIEELKDENKLMWYERLTGIHIMSLDVKLNERAKDVEYFKYEVTAAIENLKFHVTYVTDNNFKIAREDERTCWNFKQLNIQMAENLHQKEMETCLQYFSKNPSYINWAYSSIYIYNELFKKRTEILDILLNENPDYVSYKLITEGTTCMELTACSRRTSREFFILYWYIVWDKNFKYMRNKMKVQLNYSESDDFVDAVTPNFTKLCGKLNTKEKKNSFYIQFTRLNEDLQPEETLQCLRNVILAVKSADS